MPTREGKTNADSPRAWAWKFRDYVIQSLNEDKPFDRFITEQLAGDELVARPHQTDLSPNAIECLTATGFLRMAADGTGSGADDEASRNQTLGDTLKIVSSAFLGLTLECAQCHDHRYDPIPQRDYFQMRAIFEPALNPKQWRKPSERLISLYTKDEQALAQAIETEAQAVLAEKAALQKRSIAEALDKEVTRFPEALRQPLVEARMKEAGKRTASEKDLLKRFPSVNITAGNLYQYNQKAANKLKEFDARAAKIRAKKPYHAYIRSLTEPKADAKLAKTYRFHRGDYRQPVGEPLHPAALTVSAPPGHRFEVPHPNHNASHSSGRRLAFARWLTSGKHPLVARVLVNRVWMHHFGKGLVGTPGDFGVLGERPTHPEVLDWLAAEFMANGWSLKQLHRVILRSTVFRQGSVSSFSWATTDGYAKAPVRRLDAETLRDAILAVSGTLDRTFFGQPVPVKKNDAGQFGIGAPRRSVYATVRRSQPVTFLHSFDAPVMVSNCVRRDTSNVATQALMVMNGTFHHTSAEAFAKRVLRDTQQQVRQQDHQNKPVIQRAFHLAYGRPATADEIQRSQRFLAEQERHHRAAHPKAIQEEARLFALTSFCHALISSNETLYVD